MGKWEPVSTVHFMQVCQRLFGDNFFYYFLFLTETFVMCVNIFYTTRNKILAESDKKMRNFPIDPHYKITHFCNAMSIDMTLQKRAIFITGVYGENLCLLSDQVEILFLVI